MVKELVSVVGLGSPCPRARIVTYANVKPAVSRAMSRPVGIAGSVDCPLVSLRSVGSAAASVFPSVAFSELPSGGDGTDRVGCRVCTTVPERFGSFFFAVDRKGFEATAFALGVPFIPLFPELRVSPKSLAKAPSGCLV